jgi:hypothetical protein
MDPKKRAEGYLERHNLHAVVQVPSSHQGAGESALRHKPEASQSLIAAALQGCIAQLLYHKPTDPRAFLVQQLELLKVSRQPSLLNRRDLSAMFHMFDVTGRGYVTAEQADNALATILGGGGGEATADAGAPAVAGEESGTDGVAQLAKQRALDLAHFVRYMADRLGLPSED